MKGLKPEMLFDVTALLITSAALGPAAEASVAPANTSISQVVDVPLSPTESFSSSTGALIDPASITHSISISTFEISTVSSSALDQLGGVSLLRELSVLPSEQVTSYLSSHPTVVSKLLSSPPLAGEVNAWWASVDVREQTSLAASAPELVGNLDGIPAAVRNVANRSWVAASISKLKSTLGEQTGRAVAQNGQQRLDMLNQVKAALKSTKHGPKRSLLSVDPSGSGKAAIVLGDLSTADYVTYMVPGMFFTVDGQLHDWTGDAADLYSLQTRWLNRINSVNPGSAKKTVAVVAWMGYQTPDLTNIGSLDLAYQGRDAIARAIEGLQADRASNEPYTTVIAHSYGSTAALMALTEDNFSVNALVLVGSPGSSAQSVKDLHVLGGNVWVGAAAWDPVPNSAFFGSDPSAPSYGAQTMAVSGGTDVVTGKQLGQSLGHNEYFDKGSESMRNMALIGIDQAQLVMTGAASDSTRTLALAG